MSADEYETVQYEEDDGVAWITLNRPDVLNAFNLQMQRELQQIWASLRHNDDVRVAVLTGAGTKAFCSGLDRDEAFEPEELKGGGRSPFMYDDPGRHLSPKQNDLWKPVIAAVNGIACGGAFYLLGDVEFIIAAESATFFDPHVTFGMAAAYESIHLLQRMPIGEVARIALLGSHERMTAARAHQIGLVQEIVPLAELRAAAGWCASRIASAPALAVQGTVRAIWAGQEHTWRQALEMAYAFIEIGSTDASMREGQKAFESGGRVEWRRR